MIFFISIERFVKIASRMIYQVLLSFIGMAYSYGFPAEQYYSDPRNIAVERQYLHELPPQSFYYYPINRMNRNEYNMPQSGFIHNPNFHKFTYNYVPDRSRNQNPMVLPVQTGFFEVIPPTQEVAQGGISQKVEEFDTDVPNLQNEEGNKIPVESESEDKNVGTKEETTEGPIKPGLNEHLLPSDFILLSNDPRSQFFGNFDAIKLRKMKFRSNPTTQPPLGGLISNYILLKDHPDYINQFPFARNMPDSNILPVKRQIYDAFEGVVTTAEKSQNLKKSEANKQEQNDQSGNNEEDKEEEQPSVAQSKPSAIALAGPGGVAQASPVGTALVGPGGLAISAPSGTAVAGPAGQGAVQIASTDDKVKLAENKGKEENKKTSDSYY